MASWEMLAELRPLVEVGSGGLAMAACIDLITSLA